VARRTEPVDPPRSRRYEGVRTAFVVAVGHLVGRHDLEPISGVGCEDRRLGTLVGQHHRRRDPKQRGVDIAAGECFHDVRASTEPLDRDIDREFIVVALRFHHEMLHIRVDRDVGDGDRLKRFTTLPETARNCWRCDCSCTKTSKHTPSARLLWHYCYF
jgi:hypothetical protein